MKPPLTPEERDKIREWFNRNLSLVRQEVLDLDKAIVLSSNKDDFPPMWSWVFLVIDNFLEKKIRNNLKKVEKMGFVIFEIEGWLFLGINGAGYDFYANHWKPLYEFDIGR